MLCPSCLHALCFSPPFNDVYRVPDADLQLFAATMAWEHSLSSFACCNATLKIHSLFRIVEVEVRGASVPDLGSVLLSSQPKDQVFTFRGRGRPDHWECGRVCLHFTLQRFQISLFY